MSIRDPEKIWGFEEQGQPIEGSWNDPLLKFQPILESYTMRAYDPSRFFESWQVVKPALTNLIELRKQGDVPGVKTISTALLRSMNYAGLNLRRTPEERLSASVIALEAIIMPFDSKANSQNKRLRFAKMFKSLTSRHWQFLKRRPTHLELQDLIAKGEEFYDRRSLMVHQAHIAYVAEKYSAKQEVPTMLSGDLKLIGGAFIQGMIEVSRWTLGRVRDGKAIDGESLEKFLLH